MVLKFRPVGFTSHGIAQYRTIYNHQMAPTLVDTGNNWQYSKLSLQLERRGSAVVSTSACHAGGPGSRPGPGTLLGVKTWLSTGLVVLSS